MTLAGDDAHLPPDVAGRGPRPLMAWTAGLWGPLFEPLGRGYRLAEHGALEKRKKKATIHHHLSALTTLFFSLHTDYALADRKFGGNAQALSRGRWLHHTSMLWSYAPHRMALLKPPPRAPEYRGGRDHGDFVVGLESVLDRRDALIDGLEACVRRAGFDLVPTSVEDALALIEGDHHKSTVVVG